MKNQAVLLILFLKFLLCNAEVTQNSPQQPFVSPLPQTSFMPSQTVVASTLGGSGTGSQNRKKQPALAITDIFPPSRFDIRTQSQGMYSKRFLTADQTRELLAVSFVTVNSGVLLLKVEELLTVIAGAVRIVFRPRSKGSIPYWDILRVRSQP